MKCWRIAGFMTLALLAPLMAQADVFKCQQAGGQTVYQASACDGPGGINEKRTDWTRLREKEAAEEAARKANEKRLIETARAKDEERRKNVTPNPSAGDAVDCMALYSFAKAKGQNFIMASAIVEDARKTGRCQDLNR